MAILKRYSSTTEKLMNDCCPVGANNWCSYQRDIAARYKTHQLTKHLFTDAMVKVMTPDFEHLSGTAFSEV